MSDLIEFQRLWSQLLHSEYPSWLSLTSLVAKFASALSFHVTKRGDHGLDCGYVETRPMHHYYERDLAILYAVRFRDGGDEDRLYSAMANHVCQRHTEDTPVPVLVLKMPESLRKRCAESSVKFLLISHDEAAKVIHAERPRAQFEDLIRRFYIDPQGCPFVVAGPVGGRLFFGRRDHIRRIAQHRGSGGDVMRSYAIIGPRRAGKTSLLRRMEEVIEEQGQRGNRKTAATYLSLRSCDTAEMAMESILLRVNPRMWKKRTPGEFLRQLHRQHGPTADHVWLLDECDNAIQDDLRTGQYLCRALTGGFYNRVVLAGHTGLRRTSESLKGDLWNSVVKETLYGLDPPDAKDLFEDTFRSRKWRLRESKKILDYLVNQTQCMPSLIQLYGAATWHHVSQRGDGEVSLQDVHTAEQGLQFREETVEPLMRHEDPLARLVTYVLLMQSPRRLSEREIVDSLKSMGVLQSQVRVGESLRDLEHVGLFRLEDGYYRFTYPAFPRLLRTVHDVEMLREEAITALRKGG